MSHIIFLGVPLSTVFGVFGLAIGGFLVILPLCMWISHKLGGWNFDETDS